MLIIMFPGSDKMESYLAKYDDSVTKIIVYSKNQHSNQEIIVVLVYILLLAQ